MVCHQTKAQKPEGHFVVSFAHQPCKCTEIVIFVKNIGTPIPSVKDMVNISALRRSSCSWHRGRLLETKLKIK